MKANDDILTLIQTCELLNVSMSTLYQIRLNQELNFPKGFRTHNNTVVFNKNSVEE